MRFKHFLTENIILPDESIINTVISHLISVRLRHKSLDVNKLEELLSQNKAEIGFRYTPNESPNDSYPYGFNSGLVWNNGKIVIIFNKNLTKCFKDNKLFHKSIYHLRMLLQHELIHRVQFDKIQTKSPDKFQTVLKKIHINATQKETKDYLSIPQEMMSFAKNAIEELKGEGYSEKDILELIKKYEKNMSALGDSETFFVYYLDLNEDKKKFQKFLTYMYKYLKNEI